MKLEGTDPEKLPFSTLFKHYLSGNKQVLDFFEYSPFSESDITSCAESVPEPENRAALVSALSRFNSGFELHENAQRNLERLGKSGSLTVVTGQQLSLYGGPLYTIFKTLTAIHLSRHYESLLGRPVIPVFWLADEDHDYEEAATIAIPDRQGIYTTMLKSDHGQASSVGRLPLGEDIHRIRNEVRGILQETDFSTDLWNLVDTCYKPDYTFRKAKALYLGKLFSKHGLIFCGSDDQEIKKRMTGPLSRALRDAGALQQALEETSSKIEKVYHRQAGVLDNTLFIHSDKGVRERLYRSNDEWKTESGQKFNSDELQEMVSVNPGMFSPNVFLRPVLQDHLLPNIGYVAGPAEIAYYGQMKSFYRVFNRKMPLIIPRLSATIIEPAVGRIMNDIPFEPHHYQERIEDLEKEWLRLSEAPDVDAIFNKFYDKVDVMNSHIEEEIGKIEPTLTNTASKNAAEYKKSLDKLKQKLNRALKSKQETQLKRISRIKGELFPGGSLQERQIAHIYFMNKYGIHIWDDLFKELTPDIYRSHQLIHIH
ncbi:MAG: bacillithiol biosynthesis cysteine-adding enzyme BshC [Cyclonatronaceae bacterium]